MASQLYLRVSGIDGPVLTPPAYAKWIKILSFQWADLPTGVGGGSGGNIGRIGKGFSIVKATDKTSQRLLLTCMNGEHIAKVQLDFTKSEGRVVTKLMEMVFKDVLITAVGMPGGGSDPPTEQISFDFEEVTYKYENATGNF